MSFFFVGCQPVYDPVMHLLMSNDTATREAFSPGLGMRLTRQVLLHACCLSRQRLASAQLPGIEA